MIDRRRFLTAVIGGLVVTAAAYADMTPVSQLDAGCRQLPRDCARTNLQYTNLSSPFNCTSVADLDSSSVQFLPEANANVRQTSEIQHPIDLTNGPSSFNLCLCALIGLGLCRTAPWVKKLSLGFVPEWYHEGGPFQIGHSHALMPGTLCPVPACCFIQPFCTEDNPLSQYRLKTIVSLWRKSQFTPAVIASRGPPILS